MPTELQALVNELADLLGRAEEKPCPVCMAVGHLVKTQPKGELVVCWGCHGTGTITDPRLQAAWELLTWDAFLGGRKPREVRGLPNAMVRGLLEFDLLKALGLSVRYTVEPSDRWEGVAVRAHLHDGFRGNWTGDGEHEIEALFQAIVEALR